MSKNIIGTCALCEDEEVKLEDSHIISKLVYKRLKSKRNSRFRDFFDIEHFQQDGEKEHLLCRKCEQKFSRYEREFTNKFLDPYRKNGKIKLINCNEYDNFIYSINWRIINSEMRHLQEQKQFNSSDLGCLTTLEELLNIYLNNEAATTIDRVNNYILYLDDLKLSKEIKDFYKDFVFGYVFKADKGRKYIIMTQFLGVILLTVYEPDVIVFDMDSNIIDRIKYNFLYKNKMDRFISDELKLHFKQCVIPQSIENKKIMDENPQIKESIIKRYKD